MTEFIIAFILVQSALCVCVSECVRVCVCVCLWSLDVIPFACSKCNQAYVTRT